MAEAWLFDGVSAVRQAVTVRAADGRLEIDGHGTVDAADLRAVDYGAGQAFARIDLPGWRLGFAVPPPAEVAALLPSRERYGGLIDRYGIAPATAAFAAVAALIVFIGWSAPAWIAPLVPSSWERKLGEALVGDLGGRICDDKAGKAALDTLVRRLDPGGEPLDVNVVYFPMANAVALPGGKIVIFSKLLQELKSPDELAGVVAHEIGHVRNRDVMQALLRQAGFSVLLGGLGGDVGGAFNTLASASYSREAEARADRFSIAAMRAAAVSPKGTATFFQRFAAEEAKLGKGAAAFGYLSSHPASADRQRNFAQSARAGTTYRAALSPDEWDALVDICHNDPDVDRSPAFFQ